MDIVNRNRDRIRYRIVRGSFLLLNLVLGTGNTLCIRSRGYVVLAYLVPDLPVEKIDVPVDRRVCECLPSAAFVAIAGKTVDLIRLERRLRIGRPKVQAGQTLGVIHPASRRAERRAVR